MNTIVMTGATSGLGEHALLGIAGRPDGTAIVGARRSDWSSPEGVVSLPLDLNSLASVRAFADAVQQRLSGTPINALVLNAGVQFPNADRRSADGFEATFAVNHLAHYLLVRLLLPNVADGGRVVITTSDTHDPLIFSNAPRSLNPRKLAHPVVGAGEGGMHAYASSKLCNVLTARSLAELDDVKNRGIRVIAYNPGLTLGTSLMRAAPQWMRLILSGVLGRALLNVMARFNDALYPGTPERSGSALAALTTGAATPPHGHIYASLIRGELTFPDPSELARDDEVRDLLWRESAAMVGLQ